MGLARITRDTSNAYEGFTPGFSEVLSVTTDEWDIGASAVQSNHAMGDMFDKQLELAKKVRPDLFTGESIQAEHKYQKTSEYLREAQSRQAGLATNAYFDILWRNIGDLKTQNPEAGFMTPDEIYEVGAQRIHDARKKSELAFEASDTISGTLGWLVGTGYGALRDPVTAISLFIPEYKTAQGLIGAAKVGAKTSALEMGVESIIQTNTWGFKEDTKQDPTIAKAMTEIGAVGLTTFLMSGGGSLLISQLRKRIKVGDLPDTPELKEHIDNLEKADELIKDIDAATPKELSARLDEMRIAQAEALTGDALPVDGVAVSKEVIARQVDALDDEILNIQDGVATLTKERDQLSQAIDVFHSDRARIPDLEASVSGKLSRLEKKHLRKEVTEAVAKGQTLEARIAKREAANYDMMYKTGDSKFEKSVAAMNAQSNEQRRIMDERMDELESRYDASEVADKAENELRRLKVRVEKDTFDPQAAALRINEIDETLKAQDQQLFGLEAQRGQLDIAQPIEPDVKALDDALETDAQEAVAKVEAREAIFNEGKPNWRVKRNSFDILSFTSLDAREIKDIHKKHSDVMPTFQGGKQKMARATSGIVQKFWNEADRSQITEVDDYFGGSGGWGIYNALTHFPNVSKIRLYEMNADRIKKIQFIHQYGDKFEKILNSGRVRGVLNEAAQSMDDAGAMSASALSRRVKSALTGKANFDEIERGVLQGFADYGEASFGTRKAGGNGSEQIEAVTELLSKQYAGVRKNIAEAEKRGIEIEYIQGNSYEVPNTAGDHVLAFVDPPYYNTKGYPDPVVKIGTYNETRKLLDRLVKNQNSVMYTDEAWWEKKSMPKDMHERVDGFDAEGILNNIDSNMDRFVTLPIASRIETLGLVNGTRAKSSTKGGNIGATGSGRSTTVDERQRSSGIRAETAERVARDATGNRGPLHATSLNNDPKPDLTSDEQVAADIASGEAMLANEDIKIPVIDADGNESMVSAKDSVKAIDDDSLKIDMVLECGRQ